MTIYHDYRKHWPIEKAKINDKIIVQTINTYKIAAIEKLGILSNFLYCWMHIIRLNNYFNCVVANRL